VCELCFGQCCGLGIQPDGSLSEPSAFVQHHGSSINAARRKSLSAHCFVISPDNRFAYAADLGTDQVLCYQLNPETGNFGLLLSPLFVPCRRPAAAI
jgi:6-phosphogluconolactonase